MATLQRHARPFSCGHGSSTRGSRCRRVVLLRAAGEEGPKAGQQQVSASIKPAGPRPAPRPGGARGPQMMMGPDGQPIKVVPIEREGAEAWAGVAAVDRGDEDGADWGRVALLAGGDAVALLLFAAAGRSNHGEALGGALETALPFLMGWFATAPFLGGYSRDARGGAVAPAALAAAKCWAVATPLGLVVRGASKGYVPPTPFIIVALVATAVLMIGWRAGLAAATPEAVELPKAAQAKKRANKQGNPLEFISLLMSLTKRW